jgi:NAD(P)-dependent dehydrogenase (short-subunit alcohol dehydrogenase family)
MTCSGAISRPGSFSKCDRPYFVELRKGQVAVVTGGASGIGLAAARLFGREGMRVVIADIEPAALEEAAQSLAGEGIDVLGVKTDVGDGASMERLAEQTWNAFGAAHVVFNNAGVVVVGEAQTLAPADWTWALRVNVWGAINGINAFLPRMMLQREPAHVAFTASFAGLVANRGMTAYCVSKAAIVSLAECLKKDLSDSGIGVSVLCPMRVESNIDRSSRNRPAEFGGPSHQAAFTEEQLLAMSGRTIGAAAVAELLIAAIKRDELYVHTHLEAREFLRRKWARIDAAFEPPV